MPHRSSAPAAATTTPGPLPDVYGLIASTRELRRANRALIEAMRAHLKELHGHCRGLAVQGRATPGTDDPVRSRYGLTDREVEVARLLAQGRRNTAIAATLGISPHTARHHTQHVLAKLGVHSRAEAVARLRG